MLVLLAGYFGDPADPRLIPGSVAIELTHLATLYHDDVIDEAADRRGVTSANARWGNTVAILTGDYLFARASEISAELGTDVSPAARAHDRGALRRPDPRGRGLGQGRPDRGGLPRDHPPQDRRPDRHVVPARRHALGCIPEAQLETLEAFGESLGMAFQLSDDIMDITSRQLELGKEPGTDLREGVYTLPVLHALAEGDAPRRAAADPGARRARRRAAGPGARDRAHAAASDRPRAGGRGAEVRRAVGARRDELPDGPARHALDPAREVPGGALRGGGRHGEESAGEARC